MKDLITKLESKCITWAKRHAVNCLRISFFVIFSWYGLLKIIGKSPVEELVARSTTLIGAHDFVVVLGFWELGIGLCLLFKRLQKLGLLLLFLQFPGTFLPLLLDPQDCFINAPFELTLTGQYIFKNLILIASSFILVSHLGEKEETS